MINYFCLLFITICIEMHRLYDFRAYFSGINEKRSFAQNVICNFHRILARKFHSNDDGSNGTGTGILPLSKTFAIFRSHSIYPSPEFVYLHNVTTLFTIGSFHILFLPFCSRFFPMLFLFLFVFHLFVIFTFAFSSFR